MRADDEVHLAGGEGLAGAPALGRAPASVADPLVRENATRKISDHVWAIPDFRTPLVPNVGIVRVRTTGFKQDGTIVKGVMLIMGQRLLLEGDYVDAM